MGLETYRTEIFLSTTAVESQKCLLLNFFWFIYEKEEYCNKYRLRPNDLILRVIIFSYFRKYVQTTTNELEMSFLANL